MPQRPNTIKVDASSVQGDGAFVEWRRMTWGERREATAALAKDEADSITFVIDHIVAWNWVDAEGQPLPTPKVAEDFERLYDEEIQFLADMSRRAINGRLELTQEAEKN